MQHFSLSVHYELALAFTRSAFAPDNDSLAEVLQPAGDGRARCLVYVDAGTDTAHPRLCEQISAWFALRPGLELAALPEVLPGGEAIKNERSVIDRVAQAVVEYHLCRHSYIIALGGGALLDAIGCAATLVHRGLRLVRMPSTVLAQADAGLGVKNALNLLGQKNLIGTFNPPWAIVNDLDLLDGLDAATWRDGCAEAFKVAMIKDAEFLAWLIAHAQRIPQRDPAVMEHLVRRAAALHLDHILTGGDPFERGSSRPLDFGHWSAHRLEILSRHQLSHGAAVAIGIAWDACYAVRLGRLTHAQAAAYVQALYEAGFQLWHPALELRDQSGQRSVYQGLDHFREHLGGSLTLAMPDGPGKSADIHLLDIPTAESALNDLRSLARHRNPVRS